MWVVIRDVAILGLCAAYVSVCAAAVAFWLWRTWAACRGRIGVSRATRGNSPGSPLVVLPPGVAPSRIHDGV